MDEARLDAIAHRLQAAHPGLNVRKQRFRGEPRVSLGYYLDSPLMDVALETSTGVPSRIHVGPFTFEAIEDSELEEFLRALAAGRSEERRSPSFLGRLLGARVLRIKGDHKVWETTR